MAKALVIVESPAKAKTIGKYLGNQYIVKASLGHIKDLPKKDLAVAVDNDFRPDYQVIEGKKKLITELKQAAKGVESIYLAADPDREGEAICSHLQEELDGQGQGRAADLPRDVQRDHEERHPKAFEKPLTVNVNLVEAQQARRVLDRLVGYKISPLLWDKVRRGLSAGRVQTVALRLIVEREREIRAFQKREYWTIDVDLAAKKPPVLKARFVKRNDEALEIPNRRDCAPSIVGQVDGADYTVASVQTREKRRNPVAPFITSTLQQESSRKLRFSVKRTMMLAQRLYEGIELGKEGAVGLITYMRTDSTRVSDDAIKEVRESDRAALRRRLTCRTRRTSTRARRTRRTRTKRSVRLRRMRYARKCRAVPRRRRAEAVPADLDALRRVADDAGGVRSDHDRSHREGQGQRASIGSAPPGRCRSSTASSRSTKKARIRRTKTTRS